MGDVFQGDERAPKQRDALQDIFLGLRRHLPDINRQVNRQILPTERRLLEARQEIAPQEQELQTGLFEQHAPRYAQAELDNLRGAGGQAVIEADQMNEMLKRLADPEFFQTRANTSSRVNEQLAAGGRLTGGEMSSIERGLNRQFQGRGIGSSPTTNNQQIQSAMAYGGASGNKLNNTLSIALGALPQFQARGNTNVLGQTQSATQRFNPAGTGFTGDIGGTSAALGSQVLGGAQAQQLGAQQIDAQRRTVSDHVGQAWQQSGLGGATSGCASGWIFKAKYHKNVPQHVRWARDFFYQLDPKIRLGYVRMSLFIVPLMRQHKWVMNIIDRILLQPLVNYGGWMYKVSGYEGCEKYVNYKIFWINFWRILGRI